MSTKDNGELLALIIQHRAGGAVQRCHTLPHFGEYSNAAHQWGVAMLMRTLWPKDYPRLVDYCLTHDIPEAWLGDIPSTVWRHFPQVKSSIDLGEERVRSKLELPQEFNLTPEDKAKVKACDYLELALWAREQENLGNNRSTEVLRNLGLMMKGREPFPFPANQVWQRLMEANYSPYQVNLREMIA